MKSRLPILTIIFCCSLLIVANSVVGQHWTATTNTFRENMHVASSADGLKLVAGGSGIPIHTSTNGGVSWASNYATTSGSLWMSFASSADGNKLVAADYLGRIYTSTNAGAVWISNNLPNLTWRSVASSADGNKLAAVDDLYGSGRIYTSTNAGGTWISNNVPAFLWVSVASSADGSKFVAADNGPGLISTSTNGGATWVITDAPFLNWFSVASSADGNRLAAGGMRAVYVLKTTPTPSVSITSSTSNVVVSWLIPSLPFTLQLNSDLMTTNWTDVTNPLAPASARLSDRCA